MPDQDAVVTALRRFAATLTGDYGISDVLHDLTERATDALDLAGAGVTLRHDDKLTFATAAVEAIADLERVQEARQAGPCFDAVVSGRPVTVRDLAVGDRADRWPDYAAHAERAGVVAVAGIPMLSAGSVIGAINLYDRRPREWPAADLQVAQIFADIATSYLVRASAIEAGQRTAEQLERALESRVIIEQAKGMLAAQRGTSVDEAFRVLRQHARARNARIHDVASAVVNLGLRI